MKTSNYKCDWPIMTISEINNSYGNGEYKDNPNIKKVSSWMFASPKTWQQFAEWFSDLPAEKEFRVLYLEPLKELCITTID